MAERGSGFLERWTRRGANLPGTLLRRGIEGYNQVILSLTPEPDPALPADLLEIEKRARVPNDISHHLTSLYHHAVDPEPRLIVELGIRGGDSTFVLSRVARRTGATLVSVDIDDCSDVCDDPDWIFVQEDDLSFSRRFPRWCEERGLPQLADVLFVDTTHAYEQTRAELEAWMPFLAPGGRAVFHDSNMGGLYRRRGGTVGLAPSNRRGVARALHDFLGTPFDEGKPFQGRLGDFLVWHDPMCNGLTVLRRADG